MTSADPTNERIHLTGDGFEVVSDGQPDEYRHIVNAWWYAEEEQDQIGPDMTAAAMKQDFKLAMIGLCAGCFVAPCFFWFMYQTGRLQ